MPVKVTTYSIKEIYLTLQGEGFHTGKTALFVRFSGCNLWSGREQDRPAAACNFCDTDFVGTDGPLGGRYSALELSSTLEQLWPSKETKPFIVMTGGEPLLQIDHALLNVFHDHGFFCAVETNGTLQPPDGLDWICMSPKLGTDIHLRKGNELKIVYPQEGLDPSNFLDYSFDHFFLQPKDGPELALATKSCIDYVMKHPQWRLSLQTHKLIGLP